MLAGAGVEKSRASGELLAFAERFEIPVATTLRAKGVSRKTTGYPWGSSVMPATATLLKP